MVRETWVQSQLASYQRLLKWYLIPPCLTLGNIRYVSRVKWSNPGKELAPSLTPWCSSNRKGSLLVALDYGRQISLTHHHHHVALVARLFLNLSRHSSLSFIALGRSSGQHPVSSHSCWMYVRAGRPAFARPCVGVHNSTSLLSSSLLL